MLKKKMRANHWGKMSFHFQTTSQRWNSGNYIVPPVPSRSNIWPNSAISGERKSHLCLIFISGSDRRLSLTGLFYSSKNLFVHGNPISINLASMGVCLEFLSFFFWIGTALAPRRISTHLNSQKSCHSMGCR